jgi:starch phosphorylase
MSCWLYFIITMQIGYFSLEFGLKTEMKTYCGGLGILAGDTLKQAADSGVDMVAVTLLYKNGWYKQVLNDENKQQNLPDYWEFQNYLQDTGITFPLELSQETVTIKIWKYDVAGSTRRTVPLYFLDLDLPENSTSTRQISQYLYPSPSDLNTWLEQEIVIGIGGVKALQVLGYHPDVYHINESHAALSCLALFEHYQNWDEVKKRLIFTTHTPLKGAHQIIQKSQLEAILPPPYRECLSQIVPGSEVSFTELAIQTSKITNGVSQKHKLVTEEMYPGHPVIGITNGVYLPQWVGQEVQQVFEQHCPGWTENTAKLEQLSLRSQTALVQAHQIAKKRLIQEVNQSKFESLTFDEHTFTIGFARRMVPYKRTTLILSNLTRLIDIAEKIGPLQIIFSGKGYPEEANTDVLLEEVIKAVCGSTPYLKIAFLENYRMEISKLMVTGCDLWLNNPIPPLEASGTSGMKAAANGVPSLSTLDGWWCEGHIEDVTGWSLGRGVEDPGEEAAIAEEIYTKLATKILPLYYNNPTQWHQIMHTTITHNAHRFSTQRMLQEYLVAYTK